MKSFMRLISILAAPLLGAALLFACQKPEPEPQPTPGPDPTPPEPAVELTISVEKLVFSSYGGNQQVTVATNQDSWAAAVSESDAAWLSVSTESSTVTVTVLENTGDKDRGGTITISAGGKKVDLPVKQDAAAGLPAGGENTKVTYTLKEGTIVAPKAFASYLIAHDAEMMTFTLSKDTPRELLPAPGSNLIINTPSSVLPGGLLGNIHFVEESADGYLVEYYPLDLTAVFKDLNLDTDEMDLNEYVTRVEDAEGNELPFTKTKAGVALPLHIDLPAVAWDLPLGFSLTPKVGLDLKLMMQMIVGDYKLSTLTFKVKMDAEIGAELELALEGSVEKYFKLLTLYFAAIPVGPVILTPGIDIYGVVEADGKIALSASASTVLHTSAELHYDEINGLSGETWAGDIEPGDTKYAAGPKIEAGISYGLGVGPSIGIYTDIIQAGITMNVRRREALSTSFDLISLFREENAYAPRQLYENAELAINWEVNAALHLRAFGMSKDLTTPSIGFGGDKYKLFPPIDHNFAVVPEGGGFRFESQVTGPSLLPGYAGDALGELALKVYDLERPLQSKYVSFDWNESKAQALWDEPGIPQPIEASISGLESGREYIAELCWKMGDNAISLGSLGRFIATDTNTLAAIRGILSDIKSCAANEWKGCNWDDERIPLSSYENIRWLASENDKTGVVIMRVDLPDEWKLSSTLTIQNHSQGIDDLDWELHPSILEFNSITIDDVCFGGFIRDGSSSVSVEPDMKVKSYVNHSPISESYPDTITEKLDMSGSGIRSLSIYQAIPEIIVDNCQKLEGISLFPTDDGSIKSFSAKNCPSLTYLGLGSDVNVTSAQIQEMISTVADAGGAMELMLRPDVSHTFDALTIGKGVSNLEVSYVGSLSCSNASDLERIDVTGSVSSLSVSNCPKLDFLRAIQCGLQSFSISGTPVIGFLSVRDNPKLTMQVPAVFDQIRKSGGNVSYDVRYEYQHFYYAESTFVDSHGTIWHSENKVDWYHDRGYGFYYSDEPGRGYHVKD